MSRTEREEAKARFHERFGKLMGALGVFVMHCADDLDAVDLLEAARAKLREAERLVNSCD